jgi:fatty-acyl-CoA synthase
MSVTVDKGVRKVTTQPHVALPLERSYWPADRSYAIEDDLTVGRLLERVTAAVPDRVALVDGAYDPSARRSWTYAELLEQSRRVARALLTRLEPGERLLVLAPNSPEWVILQMGAGLAGLVLATANPAYQEREIEYVMRRSGAAAVVLADDYRGHDLLSTVTRLAADIPAVRTLWRLSEWSDWLRDGDTDAALPEVDAASPAQIQYTGGTTGFPKGVLLHHRGICNTPNLVLTQCGMQLGDVWVNAMPLFHVGGCVTTGLGIVNRQGTHVVAPEFEPGLVLDLLETQRANMSLLVPTMLIRMLDHPDFPGRDMSSVHTLVSGAAPVPAELIRRTKAAFGCSFTNIYGQTEVSGVVTTTRVDDTPEDQADTIGRPVKQVEIKIADLVDGEPVPIGTVGEIRGRGHQMMIGYLDEPELSRATLDDDGWLHTGDLGTMDERGYLRITGRLKEMIIRGGENISPREVEDVLFEHPDVAEAVVLGVPDEELGEAVAAVIRTVPGASVGSGDLVAYCRSRIARFKAPSRWFFVDAYPTTAAGKIQKFALRDLIADGSLSPAELTTRGTEARTWTSS